MFHDTDARMLDISARKMEQFISQYFSLEMFVCTLLEHNYQ